MAADRKILVLGVALALVLGFLATGLHGTDLRGGRLGPQPAHVGVPGGAVVLVDPHLLYVIFQVLLALAVTGAVVGLFLPEGRREAVLRLAAGAALASLVFLVIAVVSLLPPAREVEPATAIPHLPGLGDVRPLMPETERPTAGTPEPPAWGAALVALVLATLVAWLGWRWAGRSRTAGPTENLAESLSQAAADAAAQLREGAGVAETVLRCWARMVEILSARAGVAAGPPFTPREFAQALANLGFRDPAIRRLTELFEEVRYGRKADEPRREEALAALTALQHTYERP